MLFPLEQNPALEASGHLASQVFLYLLSNIKFSYHATFIMAYHWNESDNKNSHPLITFIWKPF